MKFKQKQCFCLSRMVLLYNYFNGDGDCGARNDIYHVKAQKLMEDDTLSLW